MSNGAQNPISSERVEPNERENFAEDSAWLGCATDVATMNLSKCAESGELSEALKPRQFVDKLHENTTCKVQPKIPNHGIGQEIVR